MLAFASDQEDCLIDLLANPLDVSDAIVIVRANLHGVAATILDPIEELVKPPGARSLQRKQLLRLVELGLNVCFPRRIARGRYCLVLFAHTMQGSTREPWDVSAPILAELRPRANAIAQRDRGIAALGTTFLRDARADLVDRALGSEKLLA